MSNFLLKVGLFIVAFSLLGAFIVLNSSIKAEVSYKISPPNSEKQVTVDPSEEDKIEVLDTSFGIVVPKIGANSKVVKDVDPFNSKEYQQRLTEGVAHAKGSSLPPNPGTTFLFAHSSDNFYNANRYNSVFYLLRKLIPGDSFYLSYENDLYKYEVTESKVVEADEVSYLQDTSGDKKAVLMTCWPPGTTMKRLLVIGDWVHTEHSQKDQPSPSF